MAKPVGEKKTSAIEKPAESKGNVILQELKDHGMLIGGSVAVLWLVHLANVLLSLFRPAMQGLALNQYGILPRHLSGLWGILFAPFLHGSWGHLIANTIPLAVLGWIVMLRRKRDFFYVSAISGFIGGLGTWLFGNLLNGVDAVHVGASGVIFGLLGYLIARGVFERKFWSILGSVAAVLLFGGALRGIFPGQPGISWEGHLFGLIGGIVAARALIPERTKKDDAKKPAPTKKRIAVSSDDDDKPRLAAKAELEHDAEVEAELEALRRRKA